VIRLASKTYAAPEIYSIDCALDPMDSSQMVLTITSVSKTSDGRKYFTEVQTGDIGESSPFLATVQADHASQLEDDGYEVLT